MSAYIIFMRSKTKDPAEMDIYRQKVAASREGHTMKALVRLGRTEVVEGAPVEGVVMLEFPTFEEAKAWYDSPLYRGARKHRFLGSDYHAIIVEGL